MYALATICRRCKKLLNFPGVVSNATFQGLTDQKAQLELAEFVQLVCGFQSFDSTLLIWFSVKVIFSSISGTGLSVYDYESIQLSKLRKPGSHSQSQGGIMTATSSTTKATKC